MHQVRYGDEDPGNCRQAGSCQRSADSADFASAAGRHNSADNAARVSETVSETDGETDGETDSETDGETDGAAAGGIGQVAFADATAGSTSRRCR
jgi:hypothetical protein